MAIGLAGGIGIVHQRRRTGVGQQRQYFVDRVAAFGRVFRIALGRVFALVERIRCIHVDEGIETFIHERMPALVGADDHREPGVADFVRGDPEQVLAAVFETIEDDAWIFHAGAIAAQVDRCRPRVRIPLRKMLDGAFDVFGRAVPLVCAHALHRVHRHRKRVLAARQIDARRIPDERRRCGKCDVAGVVHVEAPGLRALARRLGRMCGYLGRRADQHGAVAAACLLQALLLGATEHVLRIGQRTGAGDQKALRHGHCIVEIAVLQVELRSQIRLRVPATQVVVHRHARVPLRNLVDIALLAGTHRRAPAPGAGNRVAVPDVYGERLALPGQRLRQIHPHAGVVDDEVR